MQAFVEEYGAEGGTRTPTSLSPASITPAVSSFQKPSFASLLFSFNFFLRRMLLSMTQKRISHKQGSTHV
jgi:hypothetical protein